MSKREEYYILKEKIRQLEKNQPTFQTSEALLCLYRNDMKKLLDSMTIEEWLRL